MEVEQISIHQRLQDLIHFIEVEETKYMTLQIKMDQYCRVTEQFSYDVDNTGTMKERIESRENVADRYDEIGKRISEMNEIMDSLIMNECEMKMKSFEIKEMLTPEEKKEVVHDQSIIIKHEREQEKWRLKEESMIKSIKNEETKKILMKYKNFINRKECNQLEEWSGKKMGQMIYDLNQESAEKNYNDFFRKVIGKNSLLFIVEDYLNNKYGYYFNGTLVGTDRFVKSEGSFLFSLKSNGRLNGMMKFEEKEAAKGISIFSESEHENVAIGIRGGFYIFLRHGSNSSYVWENSQFFDYHGTTKAFHPDVSDNNYTTIVPKRFVVIQMK